MTAAKRRATATTRPGYATYPDTAPGTPSWWHRQPAQDAAERPTTPAAEAGTPTPATAHTEPPHATRWRWWHRWTQRTAA